MTTIDKDLALVTVVSVFTVAAARQAELAALLVRATDETMKQLPGFISASIHRSLDGWKVISYAQWRSEADYLAMKENPKASERMKVVAALAGSEPIFCEVVASIESPIVPAAQDPSLGTHADSLRPG